MKNYLISEAIGDIAGSAYEGKGNRVKDYGRVKMFSSRAHFTDDTVLTFACAEAFIDHLDMTMNLWKCANEHRHAGFSSTFKKWFASHKPQPYRSLGNGSAMRCSSAGWLAQTEEECVRMATETAAPTHNHPEGIKGAVVTALTIFHLKNGKDKDFVREQLLNRFYPDWANKSYADIHDDYTFYSTCPGTVGPAIICFLDSKDYVDCIKLAISLGGDADTLAAIAGPMAYAYYKHMPDALVYQALKKLPDWMAGISERFDGIVNSLISIDLSHRRQPSESYKADSQDESSKDNWTDKLAIKYDKDHNILLRAPEEMIASFVRRDNRAIYTNMKRESIYVESLLIPYSTKQIGKYAFMGCRCLKFITFPSSIQVIDEHAFEGCINLLFVSLPEGVQYIKKGAFQYCSNLRYIKIPSSVKHIGENVLNGCDKLDVIVVDSNNCYYDSRDNCNAIIETDSDTLISSSSTTLLPKDLKVIGNGVYSYKDFKSIIIPDSVKTIGVSAFSNCKKMENIVFPKQLLKIGDNAFQNCRNLSSIVMPETLEEIGCFSFCHCWSLNSITIPNRVKRIGDYSFAYCSGLTSVSIPSSVEEIGVFTFEGCSKLRSIHIPSGSRKQFEKLLPFNTSILVEEYNNSL